MNRRIRTNLEGPIISHSACAVRFLEPSEFREHVRRANLVVAHAETGSIITALELGTPIIMLPTRAHLGEHQSDHQIGTAIRFGQKQGVTVADNEEDIIVKVDHLGESIGSAATIASQASSASIDFIRNFIYDA